MSEPLKSRTALVTGSSSGIGAAIADAMAAAGARVIRHGHLPVDRLDYLQADLSAENCLIDDAFALAPDLDLLISNAGSFFDLPFLDMTPMLWEKTLALNLTAPYFLIQAFAKRLAEQRRSGAVVVTTSTNGFQAEYDSSAYDISKGALVMLTRTLAVSLADKGIRVNAIAPGLIRTPLTDPWLTEHEALRHHYERAIPAGRVGKTDDCAAAVVFLASEAAAYITGQTLAIDGGLSVSQISRL